MLEELCKTLEHFETDPWAAKAILKREILTPLVLDPCTGTGILAEAAKAEGYSVVASDIHDWGYPGTRVADFLTAPCDISGQFTVLMNPPFSEAIEFVQRSFDIGARKVVAFQRFAWWECDNRRGFWDLYPPNRIYICGNRATCWRHDLPKDEHGNRYDPVNGKKLAGTSTAHAWFVWEQGQPRGTLTGHIWRSDAND